jgi:hypothetical protein
MPQVLNNFSSNQLYSLIARTQASNFLYQATSAVIGACILAKGKSTAAAYLLWALCNKADTSEVSQQHHYTHVLQCACFGWCHSYKLPRRPECSTSDSCAPQSVGLTNEWA